MTNTIVDNCTLQVSDGETVLDNSNGQLARHVTVLNVHITNGKQQVNHAALGTVVEVITQTMVPWTACRPKVQDMLYTKKFKQNNSQTPYITFTCRSNINVG